jgi:hypothetical protein
MEEGAEDGSSDSSSVISEVHHGVFADPEDMKHQLRAHLADPEYDVRDLYHDNGFCQWIARTDFFRKCFIICHCYQRSMVIDRYRSQPTRFQFSQRPGVHYR